MGLGRLAARDCRPCACDLSLEPPPSVPIGGAPKTPCSPSKVPVRCVGSRGRCIDGAAHCGGVRDKTRATMMDRIAMRGCPSAMDVSNLHEEGAGHEPDHVGAVGRGGGKCYARGEHGHLARECTTKGRKKGSGKREARALGCSTACRRERHWGMRRDQGMLDPIYGPLRDSDDRVDTMDAAIRDAHPHFANRIPIRRVGGSRPFAGMPMLSCLASRTPRPLLTCRSTVSLWMSRPPS